MLSSFQNIKPLCRDFKSDVNTKQHTRGCFYDLETETFLFGAIKDALTSEDLKLAVCLHWGAVPGAALTDVAALTAAEQI